MTLRRQILIHLLIAGVIAGSLYDIVTSQEHWPFSDYPMFSTIHRKPTLDNWYRLFGVTLDGQERAILRYSELWPLDQSRLPLGIRRIDQSGDSETRVRAALEDILRRYEARRAHGLQHGPSLKAIRLYSVSWDLELALFSRRLRAGIILGGVGLIVGIRVLMGPTFENFLLVNVFWVPWDRVGAWLRAPGQNGCSSVL
jgi:hypothetical protein